MESIILFICLLVIPCLCFSMVNIAYSNHISTSTKKKLSGFDVARKILDDNGLNKMYIVEVKGNLNDHYDYNQRVIRLSTEVYNNETIAANLIAAKICSYAIQDNKNNSLMKFRSVLNPFITFVTYAAYILFILSLCLQDFSIVRIAALLLMISLVFHLLTLPVEYDATKLAKENLNKLKILDKHELENGKTLFKVMPYMFLMTILTCISNLFNELVYNFKKRG